MRAIPNTHDIADVKMRNILSALKEAVEILAGVRGTTSERALIVSDLVNLGLIGVKNDGSTLYNPSSPAAPAFSTGNVLGSSAYVGGISGTLEAIDPVTKTTKTFTVTGGRISGMA
jgi:hypothetical protein